MNALLRIIAGILVLLAALIVVAKINENPTPQSATTEPEDVHPVSHHPLALDPQVSDAFPNSAEKESEQNSHPIAHSPDAPPNNDVMEDTVEDESFTEPTKVSSINPSEISSAALPELEPSQNEALVETIGNPATTTSLSHDHARAIAFRRQLRLEIEQIEDSAESPTVLKPAAWVDLGDDPSVPAEHSAGIQKIAEELKEKIEESDLDPASPEYRRVWNRAVRESDWKFRARFGARAWTRHHIQAHHMAANPVPN